MKAHMIPIYLSEWVEPYGLTQYIIFITNINIHMRSLLGEVAGAWLLAKQNCLTRHYPLFHIFHVAMKTSAHRPKTMPHSCHHYFFI